MFQWYLNIDRRVLDDEINGKETKGSALTMPTMDKYCTMLALGFFDKADYCVDDILVNDILNIVLSPVEGKEAHTLDGTIILAMSSCTVNNVSNLVKREPFDVLSYR